jgi:glucosamine--fructose-6-phosphate aminotransferase (isomerizing)
VTLPTYRIIEGAYLQDILDQPRSLAATLQELRTPEHFELIARKLKNGELKRIVLTGMGSSFHALYPLHILLTSQGFMALLIETAELVHYFPRLLDAETIIVAVSQSGQSAEIVRLLGENRGRARIVAVTNTADSPLASQADAVFLTNAGQEFSVSCKTYVTALMALSQMGALFSNGDPGLTRSELAQAAPAVASYLDSWQEHVKDLCDCLENSRHLFLVGRGLSLAAVGTGALIIKESTHYHAEGMSSAAFRHGPREMLSKEACVFVFTGEERTRALNMELKEDIRRMGSRGELIGNNAELPSLRIPPVPNSILPILEILPVEMITLALAAQASREAGRFTWGSKITTTE